MSDFSEQDRTKMVLRWLVASAVLLALIGLILPSGDAGDAPGRKAKPVLLMSSLALAMGAFFICLANWIPGSPPLDASYVSGMSIQETPPDGSDLKIRDEFRERFRNGPIGFWVESLAFIGFGPWAWDPPQWVRFRDDGSGNYFIGWGDDEIHPFRWSSTGPCEIEIVWTDRFADEFDSDAPTTSRVTYDFIASPGCKFALMYQTHEGQTNVNPRKDQIWFWEVKGPLELRPDMAP